MKNAVHSTGIPAYSHKFGGLMSDEIQKANGVPGLLSRLNEKLFGSQTHTLKKIDSKEAGEEDVWLHTGCRMCTQPRCGMRVHRKNGIVVETEGDPKHPMNKRYALRPGTGQHL